MYQRDFMGLDEAKKAADAILARASKNKPFYPIAVAVVDINGDLIYFAKLDGAFKNQVRMAINKAYTAALMRRSTAVFGKSMREKWDLSLDAWCDEKYTDVAGGVCITTKDGKPIAGIGVSGIPTPEGDEEMVLFGPKALDLPAI